MRTDFDFAPYYRDTVGFDRALPRAEFFYRQIVTAANLIESNGTAADRIDDHRLASGDPAFRIGWW